MPAETINPVLIERPDSEPATLSSYEPDPAYQIESLAKAAESFKKAAHVFPEDPCRDAAMACAAAAIRLAERIK